MDQILGQARAQGKPEKVRRFRLRLRLNHVLFLAVVVLPVLLVSAYMYLLATDRYESIASTNITEEKSSTASLDLSMLGLSNTAADSDALILKQFIESKDMLMYLDEKIRLREHVTSPEIDFYSRMSSDASLEDFHDYYIWLIYMMYETDSKLLKFSVQAFDPQYAQQMLKVMVARSQAFMDDLNDRVTREQLQFFDREISSSEARLKAAKEELISFQRKNRLLTTESEGAAILATIHAMEQSVVQKQSDLNARLEVLDKSAPQLQTLQLEIKALQNQIAESKDRLAGSSVNSMTELDSKFREIQLNLEFVTNIYKSNLNALEQARLEAARRLKFLVVVTEPSLPQTSEYPQRGYAVITAALVCMVLFAVASLSASIIREHS
jgi:capsular polysaccharide transport system permease protein